MKRSKVGNISIHSGRRKPTGGSKPRCRVCKEKIEDNALGILVKPFAEMPGQFHQDCALQLADEIRLHCTQNAPNRS